ncbi:MAG: hypothetical protein IKM00_10485 [Clostridia bacterium]|nr:hypothetical protein [Clostridia bacterium]
MKESFVFFKSYYEAASALPPEIRLEIYDAVCRYALYGEVGEMSDMTRAMFTLMRANLDATEKKYRDAVESGKKGGRPRKNTEKKTDQNPPFSKTETNQNPPFSKTETNQNPPFSKTETNQNPPFSKTETDQNPPFSKTETDQNPPFSKTETDQNPPFSKTETDQNLPFCETQRNQNLNDNDNDNVTDAENDHENDAVDVNAADADADRFAAAYGADFDEAEEAEEAKNQKRLFEKPLAVLPLADGTEHPVFSDSIDALRPIYPGVDLNAELLRMKAWLDSNPKRRKRREEIDRFISGWFNRELEKRRHGNYAPAPRKTEAASSDSGFNDDWQEFFNLAVIGPPS